MPIDTDNALFKFLLVSTCVILETYQQKLQLYEKLEFQLVNVMYFQRSEKYSIKVYVNNDSLFS